MNPTTIFAECDDCGCVVSPSDRPIRPPGSAIGLRCRGDDWATTCEILCPECWSRIHVPLPDGVTPSEVYGPAEPLDYRDRAKEAFRRKMADLRRECSDE